MGMFDWVRYGEHEDYQTKGLVCGLCNYKIEDGVLWKEEAEYTWVDDDSRFGGYLDKQNSRWVAQYQYSGEVNFYRNLDRTYKLWEEFNAFFIDGKLVKIVRSETTQ